MKNILFTLIAAILYPIQSFSAIKTVVSPGNGMDIRPNITMAIAESKDDDTISLPAGSFIISNNITIDKSVTIIGAGITGTILYRSESVTDATLSGWEVMFYFTKKVIFSSVTLKSKRPSVIAGDGFSLSLDIGIKTYYTDFVIKDCRFEYFGNAAVMVKHRDTLARGFITGCEFYQNSKGWNGQGFGYGVVVYGEGLTWVSDPKLGSNNFIFIENNCFDFHRHSIASNYGALAVFRYNTINHNIIAAPYIHTIDSHDASLGRFPTRAMEIYNNILISTTFVNGNSIQSEFPIPNVIEKAICVRAGDAVVFNNTISGYRFGVTVSSPSANCNYPYVGQPGYISGVRFGPNHTGVDSGRGDGDVFYWNNYFTPYISNPKVNSSEFYNYTPNYFKESRDYHPFEKPGYKPYPYPIK